MTYTVEQREKHREMVNEHMKGYTHEAKERLYHFALCNWPNDAEMMQAIEDKKKEISLEATQEELNQLNMRI